MRRATVPGRALIGTLLLLGVLTAACDDTPTLPPELIEAELADEAARLAEADAPPPPPPDDEVPPGPHGGRRITLPDDAGCVEWLPEENRLWLLDPEDAPLPEVEDLVLVFATPDGPRYGSLERCPDTEPEAACWRTPDEAAPGRSTSSLLRFEYRGTPFRVRLMEKDIGSEPVPVPAYPLLNGDDE